MKILVRSSFVGIALFLLVACGGSPLYTKSYSFENNEWKQDVKPVFKVQIPDTTNFYNIQITLRTTESYGFNNLWFFLHTRTPKGQTGREPLELKIANPDGSWAGEKSGTIITTTASFKHRRFPQKGWYTFTFEQGITDKIAKNVMDISYTVALDENQQP